MKTNLIRVQNSESPSMKYKTIVLGDINSPMRGFRLYTHNGKLSNEELNHLLNEVAERAYNEGLRDSAK